jgi:hypothetical protein
MQLPTAVSGTVRRSNASLGFGVSRNIFFVALRKILMAKGLRARGMERSGQNLEPKELAAKVFWNKDLALRALCAEPLRGALAENGLGELSRICSACAFQNSQ